MAKKCASCGFDKNPDNAHYCGKCGKQIGYETYKLYNASSYTPIFNYTLNKYRQYEKKVNSSWVLNAADNINNWWSDKGKDMVSVIGWIAGGAIAIFGILIFVFNGFKSCSSPKIARIEIDGKYGIDSGKDNLLVPAIYDSISASPSGGQWVLYDNTNNLQGVAYASDTISAIIEPAYSRVIRYPNGNSILEQKDPDGKTYYYISNEGKLPNPQKYAEILKPEERILLQCYIAYCAGGGYQLLGDDTMPIDGKTYYSIQFDPYELLRATEYKPGTKQAGNVVLLDFSGKRVSDKDFYMVKEFTDGVAWANLTSADSRNSIYSVIDRSGNTLFKKLNVKDVAGFGDGIGWYTTSNAYGTKKYNAVDKSGRDLFQADARRVYPYTMGLAPIVTGKSYSDEKYGFIDTTGKEVIPAKYVISGNRRFGSDSIMHSVYLDGVEGTLHRNGTFTPK